MRHLLIITFLLFCGRVSRVHSQVEYKVEKISAFSELLEIKDIQEELGSRRILIEGAKNAIYQLDFIKITPEYSDITNKKNIDKVKEKQIDSIKNLVVFDAVYDLSIVDNKFVISGKKNGKDGVYIDIKHTYKLQEDLFFTDKKINFLFSENKFLYLVADSTNDNILFYKWKIGNNKVENKINIIAEKTLKNNIFMTQSKNYIWLTKKDSNWIIYIDKENISKYQKITLQKDILISALIYVKSLNKILIGTHNGGLFEINLPPIENEVSSGEEEKRVDTSSNQITSILPNKKQENKKPKISDAEEDTNNAQSKYAKNTETQPAIKIDSCKLVITNEKDKNLQTYGVTKCSIHGESYLTNKKCQHHKKQVIDPKKDEKPKVVAPNNGEINNYSKSIDNIYLRIGFKDTTSKEIYSLVSNKIIFYRIAFKLDSLKKIKTKYTIEISVPIYGFEDATIRKHIENNRTKYGEQIKSQILNSYENISPYQNVQNKDKLEEVTKEGYIPEVLSFKPNNSKITEPNIKNQTFEIKGGTCNNWPESSLKYEKNNDCNFYLRVIIRITTDKKDTETTKEKNNKKK